ncbi:MAG: hypothetical protein U0168_29490 [Nannocystaceae bacterium]
MRLHALVLTTLVLACGKDSDNTGDSSSSTGGSSGETSATASATLTSTTATSMSATGMSDSATMGTTMTTDATDSATMTTAVDSSGTTDATTTTDATASGSGGSSSGGGGSSSGGGNPGVYQPCDLTDPENPVCEVDGEQCAVLPDGQNWCSAPCDMDASGCPDGATGTAEVACSNFFGQCALNCPNGDECPDGMECVDLQQVQRCAWPAL